MDRANGGYSSKAARYHLVHTQENKDAHIYTDSNYCTLVVWGLATGHARYNWAARPPNMAEMKQILVMQKLLGNRVARIRACLAQSGPPHLFAASVGSRWLLNRLLGRP